MTHYFGTTFLWKGILEKSFNPLELLLKVQLLQEYERFLDIHQPHRTVVQNFQYTFALITTDNTRGFLTLDQELEAIKPSNFEVYMSLDDTDSIVSCVNAQKQAKDDCAKLLNHLRKLSTDGNTTYGTSIVACSEKFTKLLDIQEYAHTVADPDSDIVPEWFEDLVATYVLKAKIMVG